MCGIFCSFDRNKVIELASLNSYRGNHSFSVTHFGEYPFRALGKFDESVVREDSYKICHIQAPTTSARGVSNIHPAELSGRFLWHNGILKNFEVKRLQQKYGTDEEWDTLLLLHEILEYNWLELLSEINGSFACIFQEFDNLYVFRNEISPLFIDKELNISSVKFEGATPLCPGRVFEINLKERKLLDTGFTFKTKENPYYFGDE